MIPAIFGLSGLTLTDDERAFFRDSAPAGYISVSYTHLDVYKRQPEARR